MLDSKRDPGASQFISRTDKTLRFSMKAFQFTSDPDTEVSMQSITLWIHTVRTVAYLLFFSIFRSMFTANYLSHQRTRVLHTNPAPTEGTGEPRHYEFTLPFQDYRGLFFLISAVSKWIERTCAFAMIDGRPLLVTTPYVNAVIHNA